MSASCGATPSGGNPDNVDPETPLRFEALGLRVYRTAPPGLVGVQEQLSRQSRIVFRLPMKLSSSGIKLSEGPRRRHDIGVGIRQHSLDDPNAEAT